MEKNAQKYATIDEQAAPEAGEKISWSMPTYDLHGNLVHFAVHKHHIGFYPGPSAIEKFKDRLKDYKYSTGAVQFPHDKPLPLELIREMVSFRVMENKADWEAKQLKKQSKPRNNDDDVHTGFSEQFGRTIISIPGRAVLRIAADIASTLDYVTDGSIPGLKTIIEAADKWDRYGRDDNYKVLNTFGNVGTLLLQLYLLHLSGVGKEELKRFLMYMLLR